MRENIRLGKYITFTPTAAQTLEDIALWTMENFGPGQADVYLSALLSRCDALLKGDVFYRRPASFSAEFPDTPLLLAKAESHFNVFAEIGDEYLIIDFLHERSDLPAKLEKLSERFKAN